MTPECQALTKGESARAIELSASTDQYANYQLVTEQILTTLMIPV